MELLLTGLMKLLPIIFAFGFLTPVIAAGMEGFAWPAPFGLSTLSFAFIIAGAWGLFAQLKGRWV